MRFLRNLNGRGLAAHARRAFLVGAGALAILVLGTRAGGDLVANGDTRTITIYHTHLDETTRVTFKRNGQFDRDALEKLNYALRDWRRDEPTSMDPRLFDIVWETHRAVGSEEPIHVVSAYRSPETNAMLRRRSSAVAKHSQHMRGKAMDFYLPDVSMAKVRDIGLRLQRGGVGYYPTAYNPFVHLDAGSVRHWPKMSRDQLARVFPDGKTVHIPSDGKPMPRFEEAYAEVTANGATVFGATSYADASESAPAATTGKSKGFFAWLFGSKDDEDEEEVVRPRGRGNRAIARKPAPVENEEKAAETVVAAKPAPRVPSVVLAEKSAPNAPLSRLEPAMPQLVWQNGPAPLPPTGRVGTAPTVAAVLTSLAGYKPADVPLPPVSERPGAAPAAAPVAVAALAGKPADVPLPSARPAEFRIASAAEPTVVGAVRSSGAVPLPAAITGPADKPVDGAVMAYAGQPAPMPPVRPGVSRPQAKAEPARPEPAKKVEKVKTASAPAADVTGTVRPSGSGLLAGTPTATAGLKPAPGALPTDRFGR